MGPNFVLGKTFGTSGAVSNLECTEDFIATDHAKISTCLVPMGRFGCVLKSILVMLESLKITSYGTFTLEKLEHYKILH